MSEQSYIPPPHGWRTFLIVWVTQSISVFGSALTLFAITIWLTETIYPRPEQQADLAFALAAVSLAFGLPTVLAGIVAGAWVDRHDRRLTMLVTDLISGLLSLGLLALMVSGSLNLWLLLLLVLSFSTSSAFHGAAFDTSYAMLVPEELLPRANGMMQTIWSLSGILSPPLAAGIISLPALARQGLVPGKLGGVLAGLSDGAPLAVGVDALTFFVSAATLLLLSVPSPERSDMADGAPPKHLLADVREGLLYIWHRRALLWLLSTFTVANFALSPTEVLEPLVLKFNLAQDWGARGFSFEAALALLGMAAGIGGVASGFFMSVWGGLRTHRVYGVLVPMIGTGLEMIVFGLASSFYLALAMLLLQAALMPIFNVHSQTIWQTQTPRELQGRVFSVRRLIAQFTWPLSTALTGIVAGRFNPGTVIAALGAMLVLVCIAQFFNHSLLRVEDKAWLDEMAERHTAL
jgi:DHA3 family macrolide efflux protein-like MFS transporter